MKRNNIFGLIGRNIDYSFSKNYFTKKFALENINYTYQNFDIDNIKILESIFSENKIAGLNVTTPFKEEVINYLDEIDQTASCIGAVNTIKIIGNKKIGYNTDYLGFEKSLINTMGKEKVESALILGSGGATKAIKYALNNLGIDQSIVSRTEGKCEYTYEDLSKEIINSHKLIINCSPVGTFPNTDKSPRIPYKFLNKHNILYDLVYNPTVSLFLKKGLERGCKIKNGLEMLQIQADESWRIWNS